MKLSYDPKYNVAYIRFHEKPGQVTTIKISDDMNIDIAERAKWPPPGQRRDKSAPYVMAMASAGTMAR